MSFIPRFARPQSGRPFVRQLATSTKSPRRPQQSLLAIDTIYPFLLLSAITSLALNLGHSRSSAIREADHLRAQISVLESILAQQRSNPVPHLSTEEQERIERQLELVGLGRGKDKETKVVKGRFGQTAWGEVFFGKKGKEWEEDKAGDEAEWEKLLQEAKEADRASLPQAKPHNSVAPSPSPPSPASLPRDPPSRPVAQVGNSSQSDVYL